MENLQKGFVVHCYQRLLTERSSIFFPNVSQCILKRHRTESIKNKESSLLSFVSNFLLENYFIKKWLTTLLCSEKVRYYDFAYSDVSDKVWKLVQLSFPSVILYTFDS